MTEKKPLQEEMKARIDKIEEAYEFLLAYAAQGVSGEGADGQVRVFLTQIVDALDNMGDSFQTLVRAGVLQPTPEWSDFVDVLEHDAIKAQAAVALVAAQSTVSSQLVDNLNANIHLRALLTDLFLADEALGAQG